jgi:chromosome segregation ATPase
MAGKTKAELQLALNEANRDLKHANARVDTYVEAEGIDQREISRLKAEIELLRKDNARLDKIADSEQALRCVRMPFLESKIEQLQEQLEKAANLAAQRRVTYEHALTALKDVIQHHQAEPTNFHAYLKGER